MTGDELKESTKAFKLFESSPKVRTSSGESQTSAGRTDDARFTQAGEHHTCTIIQEGMFRFRYVKYFLRDQNV